MKTWLFWDAWHFEYLDNVALRQGRPVRRPEAPYEDPLLDWLGAWPCVWRDPASGRWRMAYIASGFPLTVMVAESLDGYRWQPLAMPDVVPATGKLAPHHVFTIERANGGLINRIPMPGGGQRFILFYVQRGGGQATAAAKQDDKAQAVSRASDRRWSEELHG